MTNFPHYLVTTLIVCYFIVAVVRFILNRRVAKKTREYEDIVMKKMSEMETDLQDRAKNLQESMQMINQEYSKLMKKMSDEHQDDVHLMMARLEELKAKQEQEAAQAKAAASEPTKAAPATDAPTKQAAPSSAAKKASKPATKKAAKAPKKPTKKSNDPK